MNDKAPFEIEMELLESIAFLEAYTDGWKTAKGWDGNMWIPGGPYVPDKDFSSFTNWSREKVDAWDKYVLRKQAENWLFRRGFFDAGSGGLAYDGPSLPSELNPDLPRLALILKDLIEGKIILD